MSFRKAALFGAAASVSMLAAQAGVAFAADAPGAGPTSVTEVIVTANKRQENIQNVGMSIQAATGDRLTKLGVTDTASLQKVVPGFVVTPNFYGTVVYTIRGVGFQDTSLAGSPTVTVYQDEAPLPFSALTPGATLDLQRVEVLKGPQGTVFGENATGGAINYIANKPTDTFQAGGDVTVGNFATANVQAYVSGPVMDGLDARLAVQSNNSGAWQKGYGPQAGQETGGTDFLNGRISLQWKPNDRFKALFTLSGWEDKGYNQVGQLASFDTDRNQAINPAELAYPLPPHNDQAAGWVSCVNTSPFDPLSGQDLGTLYYTPYNPDGTKVTSGPTTGIVPTGAAHGPNVESMGSGSASWAAGAQPTHCIPMRRNNDFFSATLRMDYDAGYGLTLTSLSQFLRFNRTAGVDGGGVPFSSYQSLQKGKVESIYQELRVSGKWWGRGNWVVGANYEWDSTWDSFLQTYNGSASSPFGLPFASFCPAYDTTSTTNACSLAESKNKIVGGTTVANGAYDAVNYPQTKIYSLGPTNPSNKEFTNTYSVYASGEYPILPSLTLIGGVRFTEEDKKAELCGKDGGDGTWAADVTHIADELEMFPGAPGSPNGYLYDTYAAASQAAPGPGGYWSPADAYVNGAGIAVVPPPHGCGILLASGPNWLHDGTYPSARLNEHNVSWKTGLNWKVQPQTLLYATISQGYKGGAFPTIAETTVTQNTAAKQELLLAFEVGFKGSWFDHQLTLDGAGFYYDYFDKQILGAVNDPVFGALGKLVNVPHSHVIGWELSGVYTPEWLSGLTITPAVSYQYSHVDTCTSSESASCIGGHYYTPSVYPQAFDASTGPAAGKIDVTGENYPDAPIWQASIDAEYDWKLIGDINAFVGANVGITGATNTSWLWQHPSFNPGAVYDPLHIPAYTLLDLRAGVEHGPWRVEVWSHNTTNTYYWNAYDRVNDTNVRYTGMPTTYGFTLSYRYH